MANPLWTGRSQAVPPCTSSLKTCITTGEAKKRPMKKKRGNIDGRPRMPSHLLFSGRTVIKCVHGANFIEKKKIFHLGKSATDNDQYKKGMLDSVQSGDSLPAFYRLPEANLRSDQCSESALERFSSTRRVFRRDAVSGGGDGTNRNPPHRVLVATHCNTISIRGKCRCNEGFTASRDEWVALCESKDLGKNNQI